MNARHPHPSRPGPRPFVLVNMAMTGDGKIATANRVLSSFGSRHDHEHLLVLRATADAVMCGARTADLNEITLSTGGEKFRRLRRRGGLSECHLRVVEFAAALAQQPFYIPLALKPRQRLAEIKFIFAADSHFVRDAAQCAECPRTGARGG